VEITLEKVSVQFENCYGINKLTHEFIFNEEKSTQVIYAPNGVMKTSFANVFEDYSKGIESKDLIFPNKDSSRKILNELGEELSPDSVFVIRPYDKSFTSNKLSTLLVKDELRKKYENVYEQINIEKEKLVLSLKEKVGLAKGLEEEFCKSFSGFSSGFLNTLDNLSKVISDEKDPEFTHISFNKIFNDKVEAFLNIDDIKEQIKEYIEKYDELISNSKFLSKDFNHYNATTVHKNLKDNGFFKAEHSINLNVNGEKEEISDHAGLLKIIKSEKEEILNNDVLQTIFNNIDKKISNAQLREFREYLFENQDILTELVDYRAFKQKLWISYLKENKEQYEKLMDIYRNGQTEIKDIFEVAKNEQTDWENVIEIFNRRFHVPYTVGIKNKEDSVLKAEAPSIQYYFKERTENVEMDLLLRVLSQGEKRTLYLLNIIFEIECRKKQGIKTLFIVDDIADSFDYKNKYAIIEYLKEVSEYDEFITIILTHNFDFFRTVQDRIISGKGKHECSFMAVREDNYIRLEDLRYNYIKNPLKDWKSDLANNAKLIATVTFARNIAEYIGDTENVNELTSILHIKEKTKEISVGNLVDIYKLIFKDLNNLELENNDEKVFDIIISVANEILEAPSDSAANLENKVVLSIAIRLTAELYMISKLKQIEPIKKFQTAVLFNKFKKAFPAELKCIEILEKVSIMTPENIHLNSFMFEPIIDISDYHLKQLYVEVSQLLMEETEQVKLQVAVTVE